MKISQWRNVIIWDKYQKQYLESICKYSNFNIVGPISFTDSHASIKNYNKPLIAIFDVTPTRPLYYTTLGYSIYPYYSPNLTLKFFRDISSVGKIKNSSILWKRKRKVGNNFIDKGFDLNLHKMLSQEHIYIIDPEIPSERLIKKCDFVISMPFTSTAIIGKSLIIA